MDQTESNFNSLCNNEPNLWLQLKDLVPVNESDSVASSRLSYSFGHLNILPSQGSLPFLRKEQGANIRLCI
jgi:hypothetical protein